LPAQSTRPRTAAEIDAQARLADDMGGTATGSIRSIGDVTSPLSGRFYYWQASRGGERSGDQLAAAAHRLVDTRRALGRALALGSAARSDVPWRHSQSRASSIALEYWHAPWWQ
jgi:hypothetical protein